jgi:hypothetical protein
MHPLWVHFYFQPRSKMPSWRLQVEAVVVGRYYGLKPTPIIPLISPYIYYALHSAYLILLKIWMFLLMQIGLLVEILVSVPGYHRASLQH